MNSSEPAGYDPLFLDHQVSMPQLNIDQIKDTAVVPGNEANVLDYVNYSLKFSVSRGFPFFTASNIDGYNFKKAPRKDSWRKDSRVPADSQWGAELYQAAKSDFDKGHMTKREDVQWGESVAIASKAADSTFYYTNAVPQFAKLNQQIWRSLEDYILHTEARKRDLKISVFTGPVLSKKDPFFVTKVKGRDVQIPLLFWKVVIYPDRHGELFRAGFLMSQSSLLFEHQIVHASITEALKKDEQVIHELFMEFENAATYQVNIETIEKLTGFTLPAAHERFKDERPIELILQEIDVKESFKEAATIVQQIGFDIIGIQL